MTKDDEEEFSSEAAAAHRLNVDVYDVLGLLPKRCAAVNMPEGTPILIKRGAAGFYPFPQLRTVEEIVEYNERLGVTPIQVECMIIGSMMGWDVPGADPRTYDKHPDFKDRIERGIYRAFVECARKQQKSLGSRYKGVRTAA